MPRGFLPWFLGMGLAFCATGGALAQMQVLEPMQSFEEVSVEADKPVNVCAPDEFTIAQMAWPSAAILANIHAIILTEHFDCPTRLVTGDPSGTISSMTTTGRPAVAPELWVSRVPDLWNGALRAQSVRAAGPVFSEQNLEGWFIPSYVRDNHPGLVAAEDLDDYWRVFAPEGGERGVLVSCPPDWACALLNRNLLTGYGIDNRFEVTEPADRFTLDRMIADAASQRAPILVYYWQPNGLIDRFDLIALDMGPFDHGNAQCIALANCVPFGPSSFAADTVVIGLAEWVFADAPQIAGYFARAVFPLDEMNRLLALQAENDWDAEQAARHFVDSHEGIWREWVGQAQ